MRTNTDIEQEVRQATSIKSPTSSERTTPALLAQHPEIILQKHEDEECWIQLNPLDLRS